MQIDGVSVWRIGISGGFNHLSLNHHIQTHRILGFLEPFNIMVTPPILVAGILVGSAVC